MGDPQTPPSDPILDGLADGEVEYVVLRPKIELPMKVYRDLLQLAQKGDFPPPQVANLIQDLVITRLGEVYGNIAKIAAEQAKPAASAEAPSGPGRGRPRKTTPEAPAPQPPLQPVEGMQVREIRKPAGKKGADKKAAGKKAASTKKPAKPTPAPQG